MFALWKDQFFIDSIRRFIHEERINRRQNDSPKIAPSPPAAQPNPQKTTALASRLQIIAPLSTYPFTDRRRLE